MFERITPEQADAMKQKAERYKYTITIGSILPNMEPTERHAEREALSLTSLEIKDSREP